MSNVTFPPLKNDLILRAARGQHTERAPVWVMRQAGRYLPEFRELRQKYDFFRLCQTPELATQVTLQPIDRYPDLIDAAIIFSDILVIPQAMGMEVLMNPGPVFTKPLDVPEDMHALQTDGIKERLQYVFDAISLTRTRLAGRVPLIGFCGAPWTLMSYMIEGGASKTLQKSKTWLFKYPEQSKALLQVLTTACIEFLVGQVEAGAQLLQVFDSNGGDLSPHDFAQFSLPLPRVLRRRSPPQANYDTVGLDWTVDPRDSSIPRDVALQGNLDPTVLYGGRGAIEQEVKRMCAEFRAARPTTGWIANLGHGITPGVDPDDLEWFFQCVHKYSSLDSK
ncbi:uroporphyrinogen decarboxylase [Boletus reticuloceps]|uniref:Uroporphyrinogen decarboxylase n=1 Tax=Boletus reticuloceps TaxID=495285 RepID=A0A8I3ABA2_9AGAM|nr:uroporphyrinogen decarboxylase [Boletus reticuloceps]